MAKDRIESTPFLDRAKGCRNAGDVALAAKPRKLPDHVAFESENLSALRARLVAAGLPDINEVETFDNGVKYLSVNDPDGVRLDFFEGRAKYEST